MCLLVNVSIQTHRFRHFPHFSQPKQLTSLFIYCTIDYTIALRCKRMSSLVVFWIHITIHTNINTMWSPEIIPLSPFSPFSFLKEWTWPSSSPSWRPVSASARSTWVASSTPRCWRSGPRRRGMRRPGLGWTSWASTRWSAVLPFLGGWTYVEYHMLHLVSEEFWGNKKWLMLLVDLFGRTSVISCKWRGSERTQTLVRGCYWSNHSTSGEFSVYSEHFLGKGKEAYQDLDMYPGVHLSHIFLAKELQAKSHTPPLQPQRRNHTGQKQFPA